MKEKIENLIKEALKKVGVEAESVNLEHPEGFEHGDYSANVALVYAKDLKIKPKDLAEKITKEIEKNKPKEIEKIEIAGPGFINFYLSKEFFAKNLAEILKAGESYGKNNFLVGEKTLIEYTDPNPFKQFHIGHLMSNAIGESLSRIIEWNGSEVIRVSYGGDVGLHVAKAIWGAIKMKKNMPQETAALSERVAFWGKAYVFGSNSYEENAESKDEIDHLNKIIYEKRDPEINAIYKMGREASIKHFEGIYKKLDTKFDAAIWESDTLKDALWVVEEGLGKKIFEKSEGAVVFKGEEFGLHTRVFINSKGVPTYEAKDLGLAKKKHDLFNFTKSIIITGNEQNDYFKVVLKALGLLYPSIADKTVHIGHGMLRFQSGKMSSRKGNVITGESMLLDVEKIVEKKIKERDLPAEEKTKIAEEVGVGAVKFSILKQAIGRDIIFDFGKSVSFEGDSGPYLQYAETRAVSVLEKAKESHLGNKFPSKGEENEIEKLLYRFPEIVERAGREYAPHNIIVYLVGLAGTFNSYYAKNKIIDSANPEVSAYRLALTKAFQTVMKNGLYLLGIKSPTKM